MKQSTNQVSAIVNKYTNIVLSNTLTLNILGNTGIGKTATAELIVEEITKRTGKTCTLDEVSVPSRMPEDFGGIPREVKKVIDGVEYSTFTYLIPDWLLEANLRAEKGEHTLVFFDECNRASQEHMNALFKIINERKLGNLKINDNVHFMMAGNLGEEDSCTVNTFDSATKNRTATFKHVVTSKQWLHEYAMHNNFNKLLLSFLSSNERYLYDIPKDVESIDILNFATYRSWTKFNEYLTYVKASDETEDIDALIYIVNEIAPSFVGVPGATAFVKFLNEYQLNLVAWEDVVKGKITKERRKKLSPSDALSVVNDIPKDNIVALLYKMAGNDVETYKKYCMNLSDFVMDTLMEDAVTGLMIELNTDACESEDIKLQNILDDCPFMDTPTRKLIAPKEKAFFAKFDKEDEYDYDKVRATEDEIREEIEKLR